MCARPQCLDTVREAQGRRRRVCGPAGVSESPRTRSRQQTSPSRITTPTVEGAVALISYGTGRRAYFQVPSMMSWRRLYRLWGLSLGEVPVPAKSHKRNKIGPLVEDDPRSCSVRREGVIRKNLRRIALNVYPARQNTANNSGQQTRDDRLDERTAAIATTSEKPRSAVKISDSPVVWPNPRLPYHRRSAPVRTLARTVGSNFPNFDRHR